MKSEEIRQKEQEITNLLGDLNSPDCDVSLEALGKLMELKKRDLEENDLRSLLASGNKKYVAFANLFILNHY